jgi:hypothetical protein
MRPQHLLAALICMTFFGAPSMAQDPSNLTRAKRCSVHGPAGFEGGVQPSDTIRMSNDGGWCGHLRRTIKGSLVIGVPMHVTKQPEHGQVSITVVSNGTRIYYKPEPGYSGPDSFVVLNEMYNLERTYNVTVLPGS